MGQSRPLFVYFRPFLIPITISIIQIEKSVDGVLGIRTRGRRMVGKDETTELWRHPLLQLPFFISCSPTICIPITQSMLFHDLGSTLLFAFCAIEKKKIKNKINLPRLTKDFSKKKVWIKSKLLAPTRRYCYKSSLKFFKGTLPASFSFIFGLFKQTLQFLQQYIWKMSI